ncbi:hypothetical protein [Cytobacillus horneckiae]|uniref:Uncharacterized protein n=1 Tax=Cytobacillus horneckiae TaxID=549687 RepID=A0A2N0ZB51_9BACI|nr:hypothetical protein [Cytobacillus horneckiae]MEC1155509.1 hypothetical protein [Cytobacillus horneckiae]MED2936828.1 hypothetical protein [Cytobacillus horneckiae]PKG26751.1 hypothetical protein CWS20_22490 [Cytobacillus horneckiae]
MEFESVKGTEEYNRIIKRGEHLYNCMLKACEEENTSVLEMFNVEDWVSICNYISSESIKRQRQSVDTAEKALDHSEIAIESAKIWKGRFYGLAITGLIVLSIIQIL